MSILTTPPADTEDRPRLRPTGDEVLARTLAEFEAWTGLPFDVVDGTDGAIVELGNGDYIRSVPGSVVDSLLRVGDTGVFPGPDGLIHYGVRLRAHRGAPRFAVGYVFRRPGCRPEALLARAERDGWTEERIDAWIAGHPVCSQGVLERLLRLIVATDVDRNERGELQEEVESLGLQIQQTYEEISLLHTVTRNLHLSRGPAEIAEMCLDRVHLLVGAEGTAIWLEDVHGAQHYLVKGDVPFDEIGLAQLVARFDDHDWRRPLVRNHVDRSLLGVAEPLIDNFVVVPISEGGTSRSGWIVSCNIRDGREYGTAEASLLGSVATILGTHSRNIELYREVEQLLVGFVQSLVSTLDAKDPYTRGHSERVALVAQRIGRQLGLSEKDLDDIHLSGLLHDIGKIGVDDSVLQKPGRLTDEEFEQIKKHPTIGYNILYGLKNLRHILPGVRSHHESWDGSGYPDGLAGEDIPLMARILAVADSYDAMGSDRPYRKGMPLKKLESIFRDGAGSQWDARIIEAYFEVRDDIRRLCKRYDPGDSGIMMVRPTPPK